VPIIVQVLAVTPVMVDDWLEEGIVGVFSGIVEGEGIGLAGSEQAEVLVQYRMA
jgi:hypothetical protein